MKILNSDATIIHTFYLSSNPLTSDRSISALVFSMFLTGSDKNHFEEPRLRSERKIKVSCECFYEVMYFDYAHLGMVRKRAGFQCRYSKQLPLTLLP